MSAGGSIRRLLFGIPKQETSFARRRFRGGGPEVRERIELIGRTWIDGYHAALGEPRESALAAELQRVEPELRGFAAEGAAVGLALLDVITPWNRNHLKRFLAGVGQAHAHAAHVGVGWLLARLPFGLQPKQEPLDPLLAWLAYDGYGFHEGFFNWPCYLGGQRIPPHLQGYERRAFDQGLGRSLWFIDGADVGRLPDTIGAFPAARQADLWSGAGLAASYAGGANGNALRRLQAGAGEYESHLAQGAAFAARMRCRAGNVSASTVIACRVFCGTSVEAAAQIVEDALRDLDAHPTEPRYERWRHRVRTYFEMAAASSTPTAKVGRYD